MPSFTRESGDTLHVAVMGVNRIGKLQPMPSFTRESGGTLHVAVMGVNRIGKGYRTRRCIRLWQFQLGFLT